MTNKISSGKRWQRRRPPSGMWLRVVWYKLVNVPPTAGYSEHRGSRRRNSKPAGTHILTAASTRTECQLLTRIGWVVASKNECVPLGQGLQTLWLVDIKRLPGQPEVKAPPMLPWQRGMREEWWRGFGGQLMMSWVVTCSMPERRETRIQSYWDLGLTSGRDVV
jgi:hypothetical protein